MAKSYQKEGRQLVQARTVSPEWVRRGYFRFLLASGFGAMILMQQSAFSQEGGYDVFRPYVGTRLLFDSNFLRLSKYATSAENGGNNTKSEFLKQVRAGFKIDWRLNRQQILMKMELNHNWFQTYSQLDYQGHEFMGQWNWQMGRDFKGDLGYLNTKVLGSYNYINQFVNNLLTMKKYFADGTYKITPHWLLGGGLSSNQIIFAEPSRQIANIRENAVNIGLSYVDPIGNLPGLNNMLGVNVKIVDGAYPNRPFTAESILDNAFRRSEYNLQWVWNYSAKTRLDGQLGYTQQQYRHLKARNFEGITSQVNLFWMFSDKTDVQLGLWRELTLTNNITSSFMLSQGVKLLPSLSVTPKVKLKLLLSYEQRDLLGNPGQVNNNLVSEHGKFIITDIGLDLAYKPSANTKLSAFIKHQARNATNELKSYRTQFGGINIQVAF